MTESGTRPTFVRRFVEWTVRYRALLLIGTLALGIAPAIRTVQLYAHLKTSVEELLPREAPSVIAVDELRQRVPGLQFLGVVVDAGEESNLPAAEKLIDDLSERIKAYPPELVRRVRIGDSEERGFLKEHLGLFVATDDLKSIKERITERRNYEVSKQTGTLLDANDPPPSIDFTDIQEKYASRASGMNRFPNGRFTNVELKATMLLVEAGEYKPGQSRAAELLRKVKADLAGLGGPDHYAKGMRVGFSGDVAITVEETSALAEDLSISTVLVMVSVILVIILYYRWWRALLILMPPLLLGALYTFGIASLPPFNVDALNSNTAFLGSIIIGNGINFGIVLLARYVEERRAGANSTEAMIAAIQGARAGTLAAALAAGVAYASLGITEFRGFRQFGYIGGIGMVVSWLFAFVLMPPLASLVDRTPAHAPKPNRHSGAILGPVIALVSRFPKVIAAVFALGLVLSAAEVRTFDDRAIEYDLSKLRRADTWKTGEGYWGRKMDAILGTYLTPMAILSDDRDQAEKIAVKLREEAKDPKLGDLIASVRTIDDVVPDDQEAKLTELTAIRKLFTPRLRKLIPEERQELIDSFLDAKEDTKITAEDLPATFTTGLRERDGSFGRIVLVYPKPSRQLWVGQPIVTIVDALRGAAASAAPEKRPARVAGSLELTADIFQSLRRDGPRATLLAFSGVALMVILLFRLSRTTGWVLAGLVSGVLLLAGIQLALGVKLNFTNFIAYPITFGIGVDYPVNVMSRYAADGADGQNHSILAAVRSTGSAVALCSLTTIIGYSSLLIAQNRALYLFGLLAVLGEVTCLTVALVGIPALLLVLKRRPRTPVSI